MAAVVAYDTLKDIVTCPVCMELFEGRNVKLLKCFHAFCCECIQKTLDNKERHGVRDNYQLACPLCKSLTFVPEGVALNLPPYFHATTIQQVMTQLQEKHYICGICQSGSKKSELSSYCLQCGQTMCTMCKIKHDLIHEKHQQVMVTASSIHYLLCEKHDKYLEYYCFTCMKTICASCYIDQHHSHWISGIAYNQKENTSFNQMLDASMESAKEIMQGLLSEERDFCASSQRTTEGLAKYYHDIIDQLFKQYELFRKQMEKRQNETMKKFAISKQQVQHEINCLKKLSDAHEKPVKGVTEARLVDPEKLLSEINRRLLATNMKRPPQLIFLPGADKVSLGAMFEKHENTISEKNQPEGSSVPVLMWCAQDVKIITMAFLSSRLITAGRGTGLKVYDEQGKIVEHGLSNNCKGDICDLAVNRTHSSLTVLEDRGSSNPGYLHILARHNDQWQHAIRDVCKRPIAVTFTNDDDFIVSACDMKMYRYDSNGHQMWSRSVPPWSHTLCVDKLNRILLCHKHNITAYESSGNEIATFSVALQLTDLRGICVNDQNQILVGDCNNNSVLLLDAAGRYVKHLVKLPGIPYRLALFADKYLAVRLNAGSNQLHFYKL